MGVSVGVSAGVEISVLTSILPAGAVPAFSSSLVVRVRFCTCPLAQVVKLTLNPVKLSITTGVLIHLRTGAPDLSRRFGFVAADVLDPLDPPVALDAAALAVSTVFDSCDMVFADISGWFFAATDTELSDVDSIFSGESTLLGAGLRLLRGCGLPLACLPGVVGSAAELAADSRSEIVFTSGNFCRLSFDSFSVTTLVGCDMSVEVGLLMNLTQIE